LLEKETKIFMHENDLPSNLRLGNVLAVDTETMGLNPHRDRLCLIQLNDGGENTHLVKVSKNLKPAPNICKLLSDHKKQKLFHFARFDVAILSKSFGITINNIYCTKIASKLARTYTDRHSLKSLCEELLSIQLSKEEQSSDWGSSTLSKKQMKYAANDVLYLHTIKEKLDLILQREDRMELAKSCFDFINTQVCLDLNGWNNQNIFDH